MQPLQKKKWVLRSLDKNKSNIDKIRELSQENGIPPLVTKILLLNGVTSFPSFLSPSFDKLHDPFLMKGMDRAVERILLAIRNKERILIFGDYDVDGITSTALLVSFLKQVGFDNVFYRIPDRLRDGYGLKSSVIDYCCEENINLLITVDSGITSVAEVAYGKEKGIDIVITDHHECKAVLPDAIAVLNPKQSDCTYPFKNLAGVGVAFKLIQGIELRLHPENIDFLDQFVDIVSLGTVADVMPLLDENRILVKNGLERLARTENLGLKALMKQAGVDPEHVSANTIGFALAPRINAAGRMSDPAIGVELLLATTEERAEALAQQLDEINHVRQLTEQGTYEEALSILQNDRSYQEDSVLVLSQEGWHSGIIGIVASKISEKYNKPCILISSDGEESKGSGRSFKGFNLFEALSECAEYLTRFGGHELAAGLTIQTDSIRAFRSAINRYAKTTMKPDDFVPVLSIDTNLPVSYANLNTVDKLAVLEPFGMNNPNPVFFCSGLRVTGVYTMGEGKHLRLLLSDGEFSVQAIGFFMGALAEKITVDSNIDIAFNLEANTYRGERRAQLLLKDLRLSS